MRKMISQGKIKVPNVILRAVATAIKSKMVVISAARLTALDFCCVSFSITKKIIKKDKIGIVIKRAIIYVIKSITSSPLFLFEAILSRNKQSLYRVFPFVIL